MAQSNIKLSDDAILKRTIGRWEFPHSLSYGLERGVGADAPWYGTHPSDGATCGDINIGGTGWSSDGCCFIFMNQSGTVTPLVYTDQSGAADLIRHVFSDVSTGTPPASVAATYTGNAVKVGGYSTYTGTVATDAVHPVYSGNLEYENGSTSSVVLRGDGYNNFTVTTPGTHTLNVAASLNAFTVESTTSPLSGGTILDPQTFSFTGGTNSGTTGAISLRSLEPGYTDTPGLITGDGTSTVTQLVAAYMATDPVEPMEIIQGGSEVPGTGTTMTLSTGSSTTRVSVALTAQVAGAGGNQISLIGDNTKTLTQLADVWNTANTANKVTVNSGGGHILADYDGQFERGEDPTDYSTIQLTGGETSFGYTYPYVFFPATEQNPSYPAITQGEANQKRQGMRVHPSSGGKLVTILWRAPWSGKIDLSYVLGHYHGTSQQQSDNEAYAFAYWTHDPATAINPGTYTTNTRTNYLDWTEDQLKAELENFTSSTGTPTGKRHNITGMAGYSSSALAGSIGDIRGGGKNITFNADPMTKKESANNLQVTRGDIIEMTFGIKSSSSYGMIDVQGSIQYQGGSDSTYGYKKSPISLSRVIARMNAQTCLDDGDVITKSNLNLSDLKNSDNTDRQTPIKTRITQIVTGNIDGAAADNGTMTAEIVDKASQTGIYMRLIRGYNTTSYDSGALMAGGWIDMTGKTTHKWTGLNGGTYVLMVKSNECHQVQNHSLFLSSLYDYV
jgi:hypothetical protein